jgi:hypothetical protein
VDSLVKTPSPVNGDEKSIASRRGAKYATVVVVVEAEIATEDDDRTTTKAVSDAITSDESIQRHRDFADTLPSNSFLLSVQDRGIPSRRS